MAEQDSQDLNATAISTPRRVASEVPLKPENQPASDTAQDGLCEHCHNQRKFRGRKWCRPCIEAYYAEHGTTGYIPGESPYDILPQRADLYHTIPERYYRAKLEDLPAALVEKYRGLPDDRGLLLWGPPGTGKTHSMSAFLFDLHLNGCRVARIEYEMLCLRIRDTFKPGAEETELSIIQPLMDVEKLVVEDVGTTVSVGSQESDFSLRTFLVLLDQRLQWCRATFITTNKSVEELGKSFDKRVASRLLEACEVVQLKGEDRRRKGAISGQ